MSHLAELNLDEQLPLTAIGRTNPLWLRVDVTYDQPGSAVVQGRFETVTRQGDRRYVLVRVHTDAKTTAIDLLAQRIRSHRFHPGSASSADPARPKACRRQSKAPGRHSSAISLTHGYLPMRPRYMITRSSGTWPFPRCEESALFGRGFTFQFGEIHIDESVMVLNDWPWIGRAILRAIGHTGCVFNLLVTALQKHGSGQAKIQRVRPRDAVGFLDGPRDRCARFQSRWEHACGRKPCAVRSLAIRRLS